HVIPQLALLLLRLGRDFLDQILIVFRQLLPGHTREYEDLRNDEVLGEREVFRDLVVIVGDVSWRIVLSTVDDAGLERAIELAEAHRDGVYSHRVQRIHKNGIAYHADLEADQIFGHANGLARIGVPRPSIHPAEADQLRRLFG